MGNLNKQHNRLVWFDIPVVDLDRAKNFYTAVLGIPIELEKVDGFTFATLDHDEGNGGCLVPDPDAISAEKGILCYFNVDGRIRDAVSMVEKHGGKTVDSIESIGPHGFRAIVQDSEGNRLALHSDTDE